MGKSKEYFTKTIQQGNKNIREIRITLLSTIITEVIFITIAWIITVFLKHHDLISLLATGMPFCQQILYGLLIGSGATLLVICLIRTGIFTNALFHLKPLYSKTLFVIFIAGLIAVCSKPLTKKSIITS